ncbi:MAG: methylmalonyl-CoA mutase [Armatimonadetes bacterium]|nr:methylmalonyl-CoA mutase [Armatimonadota bacterium]
MSDRKPKFETLSGVPIEREYGPQEAGKYPYTRGIHETMYRGKLWTTRQFSGFATPQETNERYKFLIDQGQHGLSVAFDLPTLMGRDPDDPMCEGEVGVCGVSVASLEDMAVIFDGIDLGDITTSMTINAPAIIVWAMYLAVAERQGVPLDRLAGTLQNDILKEYIAQKEWVYPPEPHMKLITDTVEFAAKRMPKWNPISISGYHIREAGSTAVQELAFTLSDGFEYVRWGIERGLDVDEFAPRLSFFFNSHIDFFEEIAKFRAARRIWATEMRETFGAKNPRSWMLRFHTQTAGCSLTMQQPYVNIIRSAFEALAAVMGGTQSLHVNSFDEAWALPTEEAAMLSLRTQQVIAEETGVVNTVDPLGGSHFVEAMTDQMESDARDYFRRIDEQGGVVPALKQGFFQQEIADASYQFQRRVDKGEFKIVGVNDYTVAEEPIPFRVLKIGRDAHDKQVAALKELRRKRDDRATMLALKGVTEAARKDMNMVPPILEAVKALATLGEIVNAMKEVYGEWREASVI